MILSKKELGARLRIELDRGVDLDGLSRWSYELYSKCRKFEPGVADVLTTLIAVSEGPAFELSEEQLRRLADELCEP